jgi:hypothetical protein
MVRRPLALLLIGLAACGGGSHAPADASPGGPDASADAAPPALRLTVLGGGAPVTAWTFPGTALSQHASTTLVVRNDGAAAVRLSAVVPSSDFSIDAAGSTCGGTLDAGGYCHVRVVFGPSATGALEGALQLAASGGGNAAVPLFGMGLTPPPGLTADASSLDFGVVVDQQTSPVASVLVSNNGSANVSIGTPTVAGAGFALAGHNCPATLTPGGACTVMLDFHPSVSGPATGTLTIPSGTAGLAIPLSGFGARVFQLGTTGGGAGTITSSPDVTCGTACIDNALGTVVLTATSAGGSVFAGWSSACGTATTCTIAPGPSVYLLADFELAGAKALTFTFAGAGQGQVQVYVNSGLGPQTICTATCTTYVPSGASVVAYGFTPSTFGGWSGACVSATADCNLGTVVNDRAATATFDLDDREVVTLTPPAPPTAIAYAPDGDLIVADAAAIRKLTPAGAIVWTASGAGGAAAVATDAAGDVFALGGSTLFALTPAGALAWSASLPGGFIRPYQSFGSPLAASPDGTVLAVLQGGGAYVTDGGGVLRFQATGVPDPRAIAVAADGTVAIAGDDRTADDSDVVRFTPAGVALATIPSIGHAGYYDLAMAFDATGDVCAYSTGFSSANAARLDPGGTFAFDKFESTQAAADLPTGAAVASTGDLIGARGVTDDPISGLQLEQWSPTGALLWSHTKTYRAVLVPLVDDGVMPVSIAADGAKHVAVAGTYGYSQPWIQIYAMP